MSTYSAFDGVAVEGSRGASIGNWLKELGHRRCRHHRLGRVRPVLPVVARHRRLVADLCARHRRIRGGSVRAVRYAQRRFPGVRGPALRRSTPWLVALGLFLTVWELATAKFGWLPRPSSRRRNRYSRSIPTTGRSCSTAVCIGKAALGGYVIGATVGFRPALRSAGRERRLLGASVLRFIGPLPATAWLPIAFFTSRRVGAPAPS